VANVKRLVAIVAFALVLVATHVTRADEGAETGQAGSLPPRDEIAAIFAAGIQALGDGRPGDAVADFEALGDRGIVDPIVSFDRGLAYAERVRGRGAIPGDLGRAAHGFEEARALTQDPALARDATKALATIRAEVARRRALAGDPVEVDPGVSLGRAIIALAPEDGWGVLAGAASLLLTASLFVRWLSTARRARIGAAIAMAVAIPALVAGALLTLAARDDRLHLREGVIVSELARLSDDHHIVLSGTAPLPEAARVTIEDAANGWARIRFGTQKGFVPSPAVRPLARPD
jgi:hypothetical protein